MNFEVVGLPSMPETVEIDLPGVLARIRRPKFASIAQSDKTYGIRFSHIENEKENEDNQSYDEGATSGDISEARGLSKPTGIRGSGRLLAGKSGAQSGDARPDEAQAGKSAAESGGKSTGRRTDGNAPSTYGM